MTAFYPKSPSAPHRTRGASASYSKPWNGRSSATATRKPCGKPAMPAETIYLLRNPEGEPLWAFSLREAALDAQEYMAAHGQPPARMTKLTLNPKDLDL